MRERTEDELVAAGMQVFRKVQVAQLYRERETLRQALEQITWMADAEQPLSVQAASVARDALEAAGLKVGRG